MLYNTLHTLNLSKHELLSLLDEIAVFERYTGFKPVLNKLYTSPLREDCRPSFSFFRAKNGHILYKDFGTGKSGDCIEYVKQSRNLTYQEALADIFSNNTYAKRLKPKKEILSNKNKKAAKIGIKQIPFTKAGLAYWEQFGIDSSILKKFEVSQVEKVWINGVLKINASKNSLVFSYKLYDRLKIYMPLNKNIRFLTNCTSDYIQGWKQLNKNNKKLIITKSLKDVMLLDSLGYSSISLNGEGYDIPLKILVTLKALFPEITVFYDRDGTGVTNTKKLVSKYSFDFIFIPKKYKVKDISDFYKKYGRSDTIKLLSELIT